MILFNPLACNSGLFHNLEDKLVEKEINVIRFNYRGLGSTWRVEDLVVDGDSVFQYATEELDVSKKNLHAYGFSLGGAIELQVKSHHPEWKGKLIVDRSFRSIYSLLSASLYIRRFSKLIQAIPSLVSMIFISLPVYFLGRELDGEKALSKTEGQNLFIYQPNDFLIPKSAQLDWHENIQKSFRVRLDPSQKGAETHLNAIDLEEIEGGIKGDEVVSIFLLS